MKLMNWAKQHHACSQARAWITRSKATPAKAWATCPRGDWLLWAAEIAGVENGLLLLAACACIRQSPLSCSDKARLLALEAYARTGKGLSGLRNLRLNAVGVMYYRLVAPFHGEFWRAAVGENYLTDRARRRHLRDSADAVRSVIKYSDIKQAMRRKK